MITVKEAKQLVKKNLPKLKAKSVLLREGLGCVLAKNIRSKASLPSFDNSAMDGFVLKAGEILRYNITLKKKIKVSEQIILLDDTVIGGNIIKSTSETVSIKTDDGIISIKRDNIQRINYLKSIFQEME